MPDYLEDFDGAPLPEELQPDGTVFEAVQAGLREAPDHFLTATELVCRVLAPVLAPWLPSLRPVRIGDPDPTPAPDDIEVYCGEAGEDGTITFSMRGEVILTIGCSWQPGHAGDHVAGDGDVVTAVWNDQTGQILLLQRGPAR